MKDIIVPENMNKGILRAFFTTKRTGIDALSISRVAHIPPENIYIPVQRHTDDILVLSFGDGPKVADAVLTKRKNVLLGVAVADCVPVLIYDPIRRVCGAVHAGWRGTAKGILRRTLTVMEEHFYSDLSEVLIAIGPSIRWCCYTVGRDVLDAVQSSTGNGDYYETRNGKICLDLPTANGIQAVKSGVHKEHIWVSGDCTYCYPEKYFSYRYSRGPTGRQGGFVGMMVS